MSTDPEPEATPVTPPTPQTPDESAEPAAAPAAATTATEAMAPAGDMVMPTADVPIETAEPLTPPIEPAAEPVVATVVVTRPRFRTRFKRGLFHMLRLAFAVGLFIGGVALGTQIYQRNVPPPPVIGDKSTSGIATPPVVEELVTALASNDADSLRSAVQADPYRQLTAEMQTWNLKEVESVETLATMQEGTRTATEIVIVGRQNGDEAPVVFNLVVHVVDGSILLFR